MRTALPPQAAEGRVISARLTHTALISAADHVPARPPAAMCSRERWLATADPLIQQVRTAPVVWVVGEEPGKKAATDALEYRRSSRQHQSTSVWPAHGVKLVNQAPRFPSAGSHEAYTICSVAGT